MNPENMSPIPVIETVPDQVAPFPPIPEISPERELKETRALICMDLTDLEMHLKLGRVDLANQLITDLLYNWGTYDSE